MLNSHSHGGGALGQLSLVDGSHSPPLATKSLLGEAATTNGLWFGRVVYSSHTTPCLHFLSQDTTVTSSEFFLKIIN